MNVSILQQVKSKITSSIRNKLLVSIFVLFFSLYLIISIIAAAMLQNALVKQAKSDADLLLEQSIEQIHTVFSSLELTAQQIMVDNELLSELHLVDSAEYPYIIMSHVCPGIFFHE
ncbi:MAG: hypothetical protein ACOX60_07605 [Massiliimalia sp.]|jgi:hypothetical protein